MKKLRPVVIVVIVLIIVWVFIPKESEAKDQNSKELQNEKVAIATVVLKDSIDAEDILDIVNAVNGPDAPKPPSTFRPGHVSPSQATIDKEKTEYGYILQLPSHNGVPTPMVDDGKLYVSGGFGSKQYFSFDAKTGKKIWGIDLDDDGPSSAVVEDNTLIFNTESCTIFAVDLITGAHKWSYFLGDPLMSTPTISEGLVFTTFPAYGQFNTPEMQKITKGKFNPSHVLIAMDVKTGSIRWEKWIDGDALMAPVAKDGELHVVSFPGTYFVLDEKSGEFKSARKMRATSAPSFGGNGMIMSRRSDSDSMAVSESIMTVDMEKATWSQGYRREQAEYLDEKVQSRSDLKSMSNADDAGNGFGGGAPVTSGWTYAASNIGQSNVSSLQAYVGSRALNYNGRNYNTMGDSLICIDEKSGEPKWKIALKGDLNKTGGFLGTAPINVGGTLIVATYQGEVLLIDAESGDINQRYATGQNLRTTPIAQDGWIYVGTVNGKVVAINTDNEAITGWPMLGKNAARTNS